MTIKTTERRRRATAAVPAAAGAAIADAALSYQSGFGNEFATEALPGALPEAQNSPQRAPYGLYAEQLSGTAFTAPRAANRRAWLYRILPAAVHEPFRRISNGRIESRFDQLATPPDQLRWDPLPMPSASTPIDFVDGLVTMAGNGAPAAQNGCGIHLYAANRSMRDRFFYDADGELLVVPQQGRLRFDTELGRIAVAPHEIVVIPRGVRFRVELLDTEARGYVCENFGAAFKLPDLGPIGSNGLANPRDFLTPTASYEERERPFRIDRQVHGQSLDGRDRSFAAGRRRLARQLRAVQIRSQAFQHHGVDQLRPSRSVDLPGPAIAERYRPASTRSTS